MKIGLHLASAGPRVDLPMELVHMAEELGFDHLWTAESYGADAISPLGYLARATSRIRLGTGICHFAARSPASAAMTFATLDQLAGEGRIIAGFGHSGSQIVEGWHGQPWSSPFHVAKDYVAIVRKVLRREAPLTHDGKAIRLPTDLPNSRGLGKPVRSILHGNPGIPIMLGTSRQKMVELTGEIADAWMTPNNFVPESMPMYRGWLETGRSRRMSPPVVPFEIHAMALAVISDDVKAAIERVKPGIAFYVGRMGSAEDGVNIHNQMMSLQGFDEAAQRILDLSAGGRFDEAVQAVPDDYVDAMGLFGPEERIRERLSRWERGGVDSINLITRQPEALRILARHYK